MGHSRHGGRGRGSQRDRKSGGRIFRGAASSGGNFGSRRRPNATRRGGAPVGARGRGQSRSHQRRRLNDMEEKHLVDTYDADDGRVQVVHCTSSDPPHSSRTVGDDDSASEEATMEGSTSESEQDDALHDLLNELGEERTGSRSKRSFRDSDEDESDTGNDDSDGDDDDDDDEDVDENEVDASDIDEKQEANGDEDNSSTNNGDEPDLVSKRDASQTLKLNGTTSVANQNETEPDDAGPRDESSDDNGEGDENQDGDSSSDEEEGDTNYISHLEWEPNETSFPPEPYGLQSATPQHWPSLGLVRVQAPTKEAKGAPKIVLKPGGKANVKKIIADNLSDVLAVQCGFEGKKEAKKTALSAYEESLLNVLNSYRDFYCPEHTWEKAESLRLCYTLHVMNHILRSRARSIKHSIKIKKSGGTAEFQDQGLTRVKVLIILPFKNSAYRVIKLILKMVKEMKLIILNEDRFEEEFRPPDVDEAGKRGNKPDDYYNFFEGDTDDMFRIGLRFTKRRVKLYSSFYSADLVIASPVGLRAIIGAEGDEKRDFDFLSSIEVVVVDQADVFFMQNWEHLIHIFRYLNIKPRGPHGVDFSRVRTWCASEWGKYFRQNIIISQVQHPLINALMKRYNCNYRGVVSMCNKLVSAAIAQVVVPVPHIFRSFKPESAGDISDARFNLFTNEVLPQLMKDKLVSHCLIYVRQYFDFVRLRNYMRELADRDPGFKFTQVCEYSETGKVAKARYMFFHGKRTFLMYTERFHFFHRYTIKGIRHIVFYELPTYPQLYSELVNMMTVGNQYKLPVGMESTFTATTLYSKYDALSLLPILGEQRTGLVIHQHDKRVHVFTRD